MTEHRTQYSVDTWNKFNFRCFVALLSRIACFSLSLTLFLLCLLFSHWIMPFYFSFERASEQTSVRFFSPHWDTPLFDIISQCCKISVQVLRFALAHCRILFISSGIWISVYFPRSKNQCTEVRIKNQYVSSKRTKGNEWNMPTIDIEKWIKICITIEALHHFYVFYCPKSSHSQCI